jgi:hypothetical protein
MSAPKKKAGTGTRPSATRPSNRSGAARPAIPKAAKPAGVPGAAAAGGRSAKSAKPQLDRVVVGTIPVLARVAGAVGVLAALLLLVRPALPLVTVRGTGVGGAHNLWDFLVPLPAAVAVAAAGVLCVLGRLPRLGLAVLLAAGGYGAGEALRLVPLFDTGGHSTGDLPLPEGAVRYVRYAVGGGLVLQLVALILLAAAMVLAALAWRRTVMEDAGSFDTLRPTFAFLAAMGAGQSFLGVVYAAVSVGPGAVSVPVQPLFSRLGLDQVGGWVELLAFTAVAVGATISRPRLSVVGMFVGLSALSLTTAFGNFLLAFRSTSLNADLGSFIQLNAALWFALLALGAWKLTRRPRTEESD